MKLWIIHTDTKDGNEFFHFYSEKAADYMALEWCRKRWWTEQWGAFPEDDWVEAYDKISMGDDWIHVEVIDLDIAALLPNTSRADLSKFGALEQDTEGNPCVWRNDYMCDCGGGEWDDRHSCQCDDECPACGESISPYKSIFLADVPPALQGLWSELPESHELKEETS